MVKNHTLGDTLFTNNYKYSLIVYSQRLLLIYRYPEKGDK